MSQFELITTSPEETHKIGYRLGELAEPGDVLFLVGELGAGKTCLTQGIARGLAIQDYASSPSFVIMRELYGRLPLYHIDLFRLERLEEISDLGLDDYLYGSGVSVIEWADRGLGLLPEEHLLITIEFLEDTRRRLRLTASGGRYERLVTRLKADCLEEK